jgi:hypothetical protein
MKERRGLDGPPFTAETVRELLWTTKVLRRPKQLPAAAEEGLARRLEFVRDLYRIDQLLEPINATKRELKDTLKVAKKTVIALREHQQKFHDAAKNARAANPGQQNIKLICQVLHGDLEEINCLDGLLASATNMSVLKERKNDAQKWQKYGLTVVDALQQALGSMGIPLGISSGNGPAARFVAAFIPYLTGETPNVLSVATQLITQRARTTSKGMR